MSTPRFLCDHDLSERIISGVERAEPLVEMIRLRERGLHQLLDDEVLALAASEGLIVVSHDANTMTAAASLRIQANQPMAGLFICPQFRHRTIIIRELLTIWGASDSEEWTNLIVHLPI